MRPTFVRTHRFVVWLESPADRVGPEVSPDGVGDYTEDRPENGSRNPEVVFRSVLGSVSENRS